MEEVLIIEKKLLTNVYKEKNGNVLDTSAELRVSVQTIMASLKKYKIDFVKPKYLYGDLKRTDFSDFQKSLLIGSILGDGHLEKRSHLKNASFREEHALNQMEWLRWKHDNLKPFTTSNMWVRDRGEKAMMPDGKGGKRLYNIQNVVAMATGTHPYLTYLHSKFYVNCKKIIPSDLIDSNFDMTALSVLIGDDGSHTNRGLVICTDSFEYDDLVNFRNKIRRMFKGKTVIFKTHTGKLRLCLTWFIRDHGFVSEIRNILPKCMHYKLPTVLNEHQAATQ